MDTLSPGEIPASIKNKPKVSILIPAYGYIPSVWFQNFFRLVVKNINKYIIDVTILEHNPVDKARNRLVEKALEWKPDYIMFIDTDNLCPDETVDRLIKIMKEKNADLVTALYFQKSKPYYPVIRKYKDGGFWTIHNVELGQVIEIDGTGMGCVLIRPDVFLKIEKPWFKFNYERWGKRDMQISEDLYFSREMIRKGMKLFCDTGTVSSHYGGTVDIEEYMSYYDLRKDALKDRDELTDDIMKFTGKCELEVMENIDMGPQMMVDEWNEKRPSTDEEIKKFYKETKNYLYDLTAWHFSTRRQFDIDLVYQMVNKKPKNILDFGSGVGMNSMLLARAGLNVTMADLDSYTLDFAEFRFKEHNVPYNVWKVDKEEMPPEDKYDIILIFDVLEHLPLEELKKIVEKLIKLKHKDSKVIATTTFGKSTSHPMHFDIDIEKKRLIDRLIGEYSP